MQEEAEMDFFNWGLYYGTARPDETGGGLNGTTVLPNVYEVAARNIQFARCSSDIQHRTQNDIPGRCCIIPVHLHNSPV